MGTMILRMTSILPSIRLEKRGFLRRIRFMEGGTAEEPISPPEAELLSETGW